MHYTAILGLVVGLTSAIPVYEVPSMSEMRADAEALSKRQSANGDATLCGDNVCSNCPWILDSGTGYPECQKFEFRISTDHWIVSFGHTWLSLYITDENGVGSVFFDFPEPDNGCRYIVLSPASRDVTRCGTPVLTVSGAACQRVALQSTLMLQFCCGTGDCTAAATKHRRDISGDILARGASVGAMGITNATSGVPVEPVDAGPVRVTPRTLAKRACGDFVVTEGPYSSIGAPVRVSDDVQCSATGSCSAQLTKEASQSRTLSVSVSASDPFGIISASVGVNFTKERSRSFTGTFPLQEGSSGYVVYTPYTQCVKGHFSGGCSDDGVETEACYSETMNDGSLLGQLSGVIERI